MAQNDVYLCSSANNCAVYFNSVDSHTATHFEDAPQLQEIATNVISTKMLEGAIVTLEVDMGNSIGVTDVVEVDVSDEIVYAIRKNREDQGLVPFTKSRKQQPSSLVSLYLVKRDSSTYELSSAWIGEFESPSFPMMKNADAQSKPYWSKHAFVWGSQQIIPDSVVANCPW